ncbi:MAG TPA: thrombospondin type 3 repeat-containing protein [bacterium]|nr:thrombospondin type 3 repeat-containing protein [bacterium]
MRSTLRQGLIASGCAVAFMMSGCGGGSSTTAETAGGSVPNDTSIHLLESSSSLLAQAIADELARTADSTSAALDVACPAGLPNTALCDEGTVALDFETCSLNRFGGDDFFLSKLTGQFLSCASGGLEISGELSAEAELELPDGCVLGSESSPCHAVLAWLDQLAGLLEITDVSGRSWEMNVLSGFLMADWLTDGTGPIHARLAEGELDLEDDEGSRFHCEIHDGVAQCDPDTDRDGIIDAKDACPTVPAGVLDEAGDGCPDVVDDTDPLCKEKPTCLAQADCDQFVEACPHVAAVMSDRDLYPPLGLDIHCNSQLNHCELFTRVVAPFAGCPPDQPPPPFDPPSFFCSGTCSTDEDCPQVVDCPACSPNICFHGCCGSSNDSDNDGVPMVADNCIGVPNEDQADCDGDGTGDRCDTCPADFDPNNSDFDRDTVGDACETGSECGNGFCEIEENLVTCPQDCDPEQGIQACDPSFSDVSDCRSHFVALGQSPAYPFDNPLAPQFSFALYNRDETLNCCYSIGCGGSEDCGPGSYCDTAGFCALIPCSGDADCGGTSCLPDGWCDLSCGNGVCDPGETEINCGGDCVAHPPPPPPPPAVCSVPPDQCAIDGDCAVGEFCNDTCSCEVGPPPPPLPTPPPP